MFAAPSHAGEERYDYDALGRLVRVIDDQGRVTEYIYDAAGNILEVRVSGAGSAPPPAVTSITPSSLRRGESVTATITGTGLSSARVTTSDPALDISGLQASATQITFTLTAAASAIVGAQQITIANAAGTASVAIAVNPLLPKLDMSPLPIAVPPTGGGRSFFVTLSNADNIDHVVSLASSKPAVATVSPPSITFTAGQTQILVSVAGVSTGNAAINLSSPGLASTAVPVFVTADFTGITTSYAPPLQVVKQQAPGGTSTSFGPFASPRVGVVRGAYIDNVAPARFGIGTGPTTLVISGAELAGVTGVSVSPPDGITLGAISVAPDGRSVSVPVSVAANAPTTVRTVRLSGASQPYIAARPGADEITVTLAPPQIDSIDPIFAVTGTTAATLTIRGSNLQSPLAVRFAPGSGITVSNSPVASADGRTLTVSFSVSALAPTGTNVVTVSTLGGTTDTTASSANTFSVVNQVNAVYTPVASTALGVVKADATPAPPATLSAFASLVGVLVPPGATGMNPAVGIIGTSLDLTISGAGLAGVTSVQMSPPDGVTLGTPSATPDGSSVTVPVTIALSAPQTQRTVKLFAGTSPIGFANPATALFRVSAPLPEFDSMSPIVLQVGAAAVTVTITGRNFQNASAVRLDPADGITVSPPSVNGAGTQASFTVAAAAGSATGPRAVILTTPAGDSSATPSAANTITLVNQIQGNVTPVASAALGVLVQTGPTQTQQSVGPFAAPDVGVVLQGPGALPAQDTARATQLGVAVGPFASSVQAPPLTPTSTGTLVISGVALGDVTSVQIDPPSSIAVGTLSISPDGTQVSVPLTLSGAAPGLRGVRVLRGTTLVTFAPAASNGFRIGVGVPSIDSITPILQSRGQTFSMTLRGQNFQDATAVTATPGTGIRIDNAPSAAADGTSITVRISIDADAPLGSHVFQVLTPGGATTDQAVPANTFTVQP